MLLGPWRVCPKACYIRVRDLRSIEGEGLLSPRLAVRFGPGARLSSCVEFGRDDDRIAVAVDLDDEGDWPATDRAVLNEALAPAARGVDRDEVGLEADGTIVRGVVFKRHCQPVRAGRPRVRAVARWPPGVVSSLEERTGVRFLYVGLHR